MHTLADSGWRRHVLVRPKHSRIDVSIQQRSQRDETGIMNESGMIGDVRLDADCFSADV